jgi:hypothetical protein
MGIIIREWACGDCGTTFESSDAPDDVVCPHCAGIEPERVFLTPPGIKSPQTSFKDETVKQLAADYGLSDVSNKNGEPVKKAGSGEQAAQFATGTPQAQQLLSRLGSNSDGFSSVLPSLQKAGRPTQWAKTKERR